MDRVIGTTIWEGGEPNIAPQYARLRRRFYGRKGAKLFGSTSDAHQVAWLTVEINNRLLGAATLFFNPELQFNGTTPLLIGAWECAPDEDAATALFKAAEDEARKRGCTQLLGPMGGSTWEAYRFATEGDGPLFFTEQPQSPHYPAQWEGAGFGRIATYHSAQVPMWDPSTPELEGLETEALNAGITVRAMRKENFEAELRDIYPLCMSAFAQNFLYTPISEEDFVQKHLPLAAVADFDFIRVAEDPSGEAVALFLALPDHLSNGTKGLIVKTLVRYPERAPKGIVPIMGVQVYRAAAAKGYTSVIHAFFHEDNRSRTLSDRFGGAIYRTYALWAKDLT